VLAGWWGLAPGLRHSLSGLQPAPLAADEAALSLWRGPGGLLPRPLFRGRAPSGRRRAGGGGGLALPVRGPAPRPPRPVGGARRGGRDARGLRVERTVPANAPAVCAVGGGRRVGGAATAPLGAGGRGGSLGSGGPAMVRAILSRVRAWRLCPGAPQCGGRGAP